MKAIVAALALAGLTACQSVTSRHVDFTSREVFDGLQYAAPKALMTVELRALGAEVFLTIGQPFLIGDTAATFALTASSGLFADERYLFVVNPETRLLTYINSVSDGRAADILVNLARSIGAIQGASRTPGDESYALDGKNAPERILYSTVVDPFEFAGCEFAVACKLTALNQALRTSAIDYLGCSGGSAAPELRAQCQRLMGNENYFSITLDPLFTITQPKGQSVNAAPASACSRSICYRAPAPYLIGVHVAGMGDKSAVVMLPNKSPIMSMSLPSGVFASAKSRVELVHGMPATITVRRDSELAAVTAVPISIVSGFFNAVGQVFKLRVDYNNNTGALLQSEQSRQRAEDAYAAYRESRRAAEEAKDRAVALAKRVSADPNASIATKTAAAEAADLAIEDFQAIENSIVVDDVIPPHSNDPNAGPARLADGSVTARAKAAASALAADANSDVDPFEDAAGSDVADIQQAQITTIETPTSLFDLRVLDGPAPEAGSNTGGPDTNFDVDPSVAGPPVLPTPTNQ
jgi:hypothetical protein